MGIRYSKVEGKFQREIVLLKSFPCAYGKCSFCNYIEDNSNNEEEINEVNLEVLKEITGEFGILEVINSGSVTSIVDGIYKLQCDFILQDDNEVTNFCNFLDCLNKKYTINGTIVTFEPDVIAGTSTSRDNVNALLIDGLTELDCIIDDTEITMSTEELKDIKIEDLASVRQRDFRLYIVDNSEVQTKVVEELGTHLVIFENYFWQPNHDNATYISEKYVNCLYHQAVDGFQVYAPNLYNAIKKSTNKQSILEDMLCLGLDFKYDEKLEEINPDDILDNLIVD